MAINQNEARIILEIGLLYHFNHQKKIHRHLV